MATFVDLAPDAATEERDSFCAWIRANGLDPRRIPQGYPLVIEVDPPTAWTLTADVVECDRHGQPLTDSRYELRTRKITVHLREPPRTEWFYSPSFSIIVS